MAKIKRAADFKGHFYKAGVSGSAAHIGPIHMWWLPPKVNKPPYLSGHKAMPCYHCGKYLQIRVALYPQHVNSYPKSELFEYLLTTAAEDLRVRETETGVAPESESGATPTEGKDDDDIFG